jgi:hypothetical protein
MDIDDYFAELPVWMKNDILREIQLAHVSSTSAGRKALTDLGIAAGGGNLLAALGLVAYSEALGLLRFWNRRRTHGTPEQCFLAFFDGMQGGAYKRWREVWEQAHGVTIYEVLRCGLVHEYRPKLDSAFWMGEGAGLGLADEDGRLVFKVEPYYRHFCAEADCLYEELKLLQNPEIPPPRFKPVKAGPPKRTPMPPLPPIPTTSPTS